MIVRLVVQTFRRAKLTSNYSVRSKGLALYLEEGDMLCLEHPGGPRSIQAVPQLSLNKYAIEATWEVRNCAGRSFVFYANHFNASCTLRSILHVAIVSADSASKSYHCMLPRHTSVHSLVLS